MQKFSNGELVVTGKDTHALDNIFSRINLILTVFYMSLKYSKSSISEINVT